MTVVYRATPVPYAEELIEARAKIADMTLTLARARLGIKIVRADKDYSLYHGEADKVIESIERHLVGTIHEVKPRAAR